MIGNGNVAFDLGFPTCESSNFATRRNYTEFLGITNTYASSTDRWDTIWVLTKTLHAFEICLFFPYLQSAIRLSSPTWEISCTISRLHPGQGGPEGTVCAGHDKFRLSIAILKISTFFWKIGNLRCLHSPQIVYFVKHYSFFQKSDTFSGKVSNS